MPRIVLREQQPAYVEAEVEVTDKEYATLVALAEDGTDKQVKEYVATLEYRYGDLEWNASGYGDDFELVAVFDDGYDDIWYERG